MYINKTTFLLFLIQILLCFKLSAQKHAYSFDGTNYKITSHYKIITKFYDEENTLLYTEYSKAKKSINNNVEGQYNAYKLPLASLKKLKAISVLLTDSTNMVLDSLHFNDIHNSIESVIINKIQSQRLLAIENSMVEQSALDQVSFWYNGELHTYGVVKHKGRYWMDRNLGASRKAQFLRDTLAYGDVFQWGRAADGHQLIDDITTSTELVSSGQQPNHNAFIFNKKNADWNEGAFWSKRWYNKLVALKSFRKQKV